MILAFLIACGAATTGANPLLNLDRSDLTSFRGSVTEVRQAGGYLYVEVGDRWVVGLERSLSVGDEVVVQPVGTAHDFTSGRTGHHYDELTFGVVSKSSP